MEQDIKIGCVIMASGRSVRFGANKLLAEFNGKTLIETILDNTEGVFYKRVVVTRSKEVEEICKARNIDVIFHALPNRNDTVRLGAEYMKDMEGIIFCPSDQPLLQRESLLRLRNSFGFGKNEILRIAYKKRRGAPILFDKRFYDELIELPEKQGGSYLVQKYPDKVKCIQAFCELELWDVDTPEELEFLKRKINP